MSAIDRKDRVDPRNSGVNAPTSTPDEVDAAVAAVFTAVRTVADALEEQPGAKEFVTPTNAETSPGARRSAKYADNVALRALTGGLPGTLVASVMSSTDDLGLASTLDLPVSRAGRLTVGDCTKELRQRMDSAWRAP